MDLFNESKAWDNLLECLGQIPVAELSAKWPKALSELVDVHCAELKRSGMAESQAERLARRLAMAQDHYMGGTFPPGEGSGLTWYPRLLGQINV